MKGIILCAGKGTRLGPVTRGIGDHRTGVSKPLLPIFDKPTVFYPLANMISAGIKEVLIITAPNNLKQFQDMLGDGSDLGMSISYEVQVEQRGTADALMIAEHWLDGSDAALIFGDNLFIGGEFSTALTLSTSPRGATIFAYKVSNPSAFGIVDFDKDMKVLSLEEKPENPKSPYAAVGIYFYKNRAVELAQTLSPSPRGELEITDLNNLFMNEGLLDVRLISEDTQWFDTGSAASLLESANYVQQWQAENNTLSGSPELAAFEAGFISLDTFTKLAEAQGKSEYGKILLSKAAELSTQP